MIGNAIIYSHTFCVCVCVLSRLHHPAWGLNSWPSDQESDALQTELARDLNLFHVFISLLEVSRPGWYYNINISNILKDSLKNENAITISLIVKYQKVLKFWIKRPFYNFLNAIFNCFNNSVDENNFAKDFWLRNLKKEKNSDKII